MKKIILTAVSAAAMTAAFASAPAYAMSINGVELDETEAAFVHNRCDYLKLEANSALGDAETPDNDDMAIPGDNLTPNVQLGLLTVEQCEEAGFYKSM